MSNLRNWIGLFLMGAINNLPYVIVNSASSTIADSFGVKNLVGLVFGANVALSVFVKALNTFALLSVPFSARYLVNGCLMLLGLFGVAFAESFGFSLCCIVVVGSTAAFGENVSLGMMSRFPSHLINAWSSGTGMAGLLGSSLYILFGCTVGNGSDKTEKLHTLTKYAFLLTTPVVAVYWLAYFVVLRFPSPSHSSVGVVPADSSQVQEDPGEVQPYSCQVQDDGQTQNTSDTERDPLLQPDPPPASSRAAGSGETGESGVVKGDPATGPETAWRRIRRCLRLVLPLALNLSAVYMFEYVARGCAAKVRPASEYHVGCPELYAALQLCYQAGVLVSRSSVQLVRIRRVGVITALQLLNFILWAVDVKFKVIPVYLLPALMIFVGLLGGASYVNVFYTLLHDDCYPDADREICINITAMFITLGIITGTGVETALFTTLLKND